jgi:dihydroorotase-like cyclic amidohydrolase
VGETIAELRGLSPEELGRITSANARRFFRLNDKAAEGAWDERA